MGPSFALLAFDSGLFQSIPVLAISALLLTAQVRFVSGTRKKWSHSVCSRPAAQSLKSHTIYVWGLKDSFLR